MKKALAKILIVPNIYAMGIRSISGPITGKIKMFLFCPTVVAFKDKLSITILLLYFSFAASAQYRLPFDIIDFGFDFFDKEEIKKNNFDSVFCIGKFCRIGKTIVCDTILESKTYFTEAGYPSGKYDVNKQIKIILNIKYYSRDSNTRIEEAMISDLYSNSRSKDKLYKSTYVDDVCKSEVTMMKNKDSLKFVMRRRDTMLYDRGKVVKRMEYWYNSKNGAMDSITNMYEYDSLGKMSNRHEIRSSTFLSSIDLSMSEGDEIRSNTNKHIEYAYGLSNDEERRRRKKNGESGLFFEAYPLLTKINTTDFMTFYEYKSEGEESEYDFEFRNKDRFIEFAYSELKETKYLKKSKLPERITILEDEVIIFYYFFYH